MAEEETTEEIAQGLDRLAEQVRRPEPLDDLSERLHSARWLAESIVENDEDEFGEETIQVLRPVLAELESLCETVDQQIHDERETSK